MNVFRDKALRVRGCLRCLIVRFKPQLIASKRFQRIRQIVRFRVGFALFFLIFYNKHGEFHNDMNGFTRQEALAISGISSGRLNYLNTIGLVSPIKIGNPKRPKVIYTAEQVIDLTVVNSLRKRLLLREVQSVVTVLRDRGYENSLFKCNLVFIDGILHLAESWEKFGKTVIEASRTNDGRISVQEVGVIGEVVPEMRKKAKAHNILDFDKRIQGTVLAA